MAMFKDYTSQREVKVQQAIALKGAGWTYSEIATLTGETVEFVIKAWQHQCKIVYDES